MSDRKGIEIMIFILIIVPSLVGGSGAFASAIASPVENHQPDNISDLMRRHPTQPFPRLTRIPPTHSQIRRST
jgi:hypothetical protein